MLRKVGVLILSIGMMLVFAGPVSAQPWWCEDDPILHFSDGTTVHLVTSFSAELASKTTVTYNVSVPAATSVTVTYPASGQVASLVTVSTGGVAGSAAITVTVPGATDFTVTQTGGGAGKQTYGGSGGTATFSVTLGG